MECAKRTQFIRNDWAADGRHLADRGRLMKPRVALKTAEVLLSSALYAAGVSNCSWTAWRMAWTLAEGKAAGR